MVVLRIINDTFLFPCMSPCTAVLFEILLIGVKVMDR